MRWWPWTKKREEGEVNLWEFYFSQKDIQKAAEDWKAHVFYALFKSEGSYGLRLEELDLTEGYAKLSIVGPTLEHDADVARIDYEWKKGDNSCTQAQKGEVMMALKARHQNDVPVIKNMVMAAGRDIVGYHVYL